MLDARRGGINIGNNVNIGTSVSLWTDSHDMNDPFSIRHRIKEDLLILATEHG